MPPKGQGRGSPADQGGGLPSPLTRPHRSTAGLRALCKDIDALQQAVATASPSEVIALVSNLLPGNAGSQSDAGDRLLLQSHLDRHLSAAIASAPGTSTANALQSFVQDFEIASAADEKLTVDDDGMGFLQVHTIHAAKGKEFDHVGAGGDEPRGSGQFFTPFAASLALVAGDCPRRGRRRAAAQAPCAHHDSGRLCRGGAPALRGDDPREKVPSAGTVRGRQLLAHQGHSRASARGLAAR